MDFWVESFPAAGPAALPCITSVDEITGIIARTGAVLKATALPLPRRTLNMATAVHAAVLRLERQLFQQAAVLHQPETWPEIEGVGPWLEIIWWNLIHKALHHGGPAPVIRLGWETTISGHRFTVRDSGPGLPAQRESRVFHSFHLLHHPDSPHGLGLPIVKRLVELQDSICEYSHDGTEEPAFHFSLPPCSQDNNSRRQPPSGSGC